MTERPFHVTLVLVSMLWLFANSASAMLHPQQGRFMQRDPLGYVDGMGLHQYVGSAPITRSDSGGTWGSDVHNRGNPLGSTVQWAIDAGYPEVAASAIGAADEAVDSASGGIGPIPLIGDPSWHFNRNAPGRGDSRTLHSNEALGRAIGACANEAPWHTDDPITAATQLGTALHPLQDIVAHGDFLVGAAVDTVHNSTSPQTNLVPVYGDVSSYPDDPRLDAGPRIFLTSRNDPTIAIGYIDYAIFTPGNARISRTRSDTLATLRLFRRWVNEHGGCACRQYFGLN